MTYDDTTKLFRLVLPTEERKLTICTSMSLRLCILFVEERLAGFSSSMGHAHRLMVLKQCWIRSGHWAAIDEHR